MNRHFMSRMMKMKDDGALVLTKKEAALMLGIRQATLAELEGLANVPAASRRVGYTVAQVRSMIGALLATLAGGRRGAAGGTRA